MKFFPSNFTKLHILQLKIKHSGWFPLYVVREPNWWLCDDYVTTIWRLCDGCVTVVWRLCDGCVTTIWRLYDGHVMAIWRLCDGCLTFVWWLCDDYMTVMWRLFDDWSRKRLHKVQSSKVFKQSFIKNPNCS